MDKIECKLDTWRFIRKINIVDFRRHLVGWGELSWDQTEKHSIEVKIRLITIHFTRKCSEIVFLDTWKWFGTPKPQWNSQNSDLLQYQPYLKILVRANSWNGSMVQFLGSMFAKYISKSLQSVSDSRSVTYWSAVKVSTTFIPWLWHWGRSVQ